jgi:3-dehydroquinate synthase
MTVRMTIRSHRGDYAVVEDPSVAAAVERLLALPERLVPIVDERVARLHAPSLAPLFERAAPHLIEATEDNKGLARMEDHALGVMRLGARRDHVLVAIGGGILQDIACFLASTLFRGMAWELVPTTLLAQADSAIGSKSSINVGRYKNLMGTFLPPRRILVAPAFLDTLDEDALRSGIGEILKVHALAGPAAFDEVAGLDLLGDRAALTGAIWRALSIKQRYIEEDEFDRGPRNVLNYGHSFGHALESATDFAVPHGIAVTLGMDLANHVSAARGDLSAGRRDRMRPILLANAGRFAATPVPLDRFFAALGRDKKNEGARFAFILLDAHGAARKVLVDDTPALRATCEAYFAANRAAS